MVGGPTLCALLNREKKNDILFHLFFCRGGCDNLYFFSSSLLTMKMLRFHMKLRLNSNDLIPPPKVLVGLGGFHSDPSPANAP
jgi:hypothetical protein